MLQCHRYLRYNIIYIIINFYNMTRVKNESILKVKKLRILLQRKNNKNNKTYYI